jgi:Lar family restriction alleviation protein
MKWRGKMSEELKHCPFCGKSDKVIIYTNSMAQYGKLLWMRYGVKCKRCHFVIATYAKKAAAIHKWNTRPIEDEKDKEIEKLKEALNTTIYLLQDCSCDLERHGDNMSWLDDKISEFIDICNGKDNDVPANDTDNNGESINNNNNNNERLNNE